MLIVEVITTLVDVKGVAADQLLGDPQVARRFLAVVDGEVMRAALERVGVHRVREAEKPKLARRRGQRW